LGFLSTGTGACKFSELHSWLCSPERPFTIY
jgi:hypothetical protein